METKKVTINDMPIDLYNRLVNMCKAEKRSLNNGLQVLLNECANKYFTKQAKLLRKGTNDL